MSEFNSKHNVSETTPRRMTAAAPAGTQLSPTGSASPATRNPGLRVRREVVSLLKSGPLSTLPAAISEAQASLAPAERTWIGARVEVLLSHFFQANEPPQITKGRALDWMRALDGLPKWAIDGACAEWLSRPDGKRPTPGQIKAIAVRRISTTQDLIALGRQRLEASERPCPGPKTVSPEIKEMLAQLGAGKRA